MTGLAALSGRLHGVADDRLSVVVDRLDDDLRDDEDLSFQVAAFADGQPVLDAWGGPHLGEHSITVPYSVTKNTIGLSVALLVQRRELDLDERVATYWPEFSAKGKAHVTVRMLLSHQAGLPQASPALTWAEVLDDHAGAERLAASAPFWFPGSAFGYHGVTIGNLASELVFRVTGRSLREYYESEIRAPRDIDFYLGLPPELGDRRVPLLDIVAPADAPEPEPMTPLTPRSFAMAGKPVHYANDEASWTFGHPAGSGAGTARGLAHLFAAAVTGVGGEPAFLDPDTVETVGLQQVRGYDEVLGQPHRAHAIVFQKPTPAMPFGGPRAFGHDGAAGAFAGVDPETGIAFAWTIVRGPWPGGADPRAIALMAELPALLAS